MSRQRDGLGAGIAGSRGGRVRDLPGALFGHEDGDQPCIDPGTCKIGFLGWQFVEAGEALHPLESQFDLPAQAIEGEHVSRRESVGRQRGEEEDVVRRFETARVGLLAAFLGILQQALLLGQRLFGISGGSGDASLRPSSTRTCISPSCSA